MTVDRGRRWEVVAPRYPSQHLGGLRFRRTKNGKAVALRSRMRALLAPARPSLPPGEMSDHLR
jgi:hypothetical protein